jgi:hypothetical protein
MTKGQRRYFRFVDEGRKVPKELKTLRDKMSPALFARLRLELILERDRTQREIEEMTPEQRTALLWSLCL